MGHSMETSGVIWDKGSEVLVPVVKASCAFENPSGGGSGDRRSGSTLQNHSL